MVFVKSGFSDFFWKLLFFRNWPKILNAKTFLKKTILTYFWTRNTILVLFLTSKKVKTVKIRNYCFFYRFFTVKKQVFMLRPLLWSEKFFEDIYFLSRYMALHKKIIWPKRISNKSFFHIPRLKLQIIVFRIHCFVDLFVVFWLRNVKKYHAKSAIIAI